MRACCRPPTPTPGCTAATVDGRRSLPVPTSASCSAECHRQRGQQFGGDGPKKSVHLAPALSPGPFTVPTRICCASRGPCRDKLDQVPAGSRTNSTTARSRVDELHPYAGADPAGSASVETSNSATPCCGAGWGEPADTPNTLLFPLRVAAAPPAPGPAAGAGATQHSPRITFSRGDVNVLANVNGEPAAMPEGVNWRFIWFWLKFREAGRVVLVRPSGCYSPHDAAAASGVLVPGTVTVYPAYRTNRVSILDGINQPPASRNLSQNRVNGTVFARYLGPHVHEGVPRSRAAADAGVPARTARRWLTAYEAEGAAGLARHLPDRSWKSSSVGGNARFDRRVGAASAAAPDGGSAPRP